MNNSRISAERKKLGISQAELAKKLKVSQKSISKYERGDRRPSYETLVAMSYIFGVSVDYLLGNDTSESFQNKDSIPFSDETLKSTFMFRINDTIMQKGMSEEDFLNKVSFSPKKCKDYLDGKIEPSLEDLLEISRVLEVSVDYLLGRNPKLTGLAEKLYDIMTCLNEENLDILIGKSQEFLKEQRSENSSCKNKKHRMINYEIEKTVVPKYTPKDGMYIPSSSKRGLNQLEEEYKKSRLDAAKRMGRSASSTTDGEEENRA